MTAAPIGDPLTDTLLTPQNAGPQRDWNRQAAADRFAELVFASVHP